MLEYNDKENWVTITFVIDEGPRYQVRNVSVIGNKKYSTDELMSELKLKNDDYYNKPKVLVDQSALKDKYGSVGYVFADIQPDLRSWTKTRTNSTWFIPLRKATPTASARSTSKSRANIRTRSSPRC